MFSQASVIMSTRGGCAWRSEGGAFVARGGHSWQGEHAWQERRPLQQTVCILLECILVNLSCYSVPTLRIWIRISEYLLLFFSKISKNISKSDRSLFIIYEEVKVSPCGPSGGGGGYNILEDMSFFCAATHTPVLDFWFLSQSGQPDSHLLEVYVISPWPVNAKRSNKFDYNR